MTWRKWVRLKVQEFIQSLLEDEVTELLGRQKSERRQAVDDPPVYRNGYGKKRGLTLGCGIITVHRPRVRGIEERFESKVLPFFVKRTKEVNELIPELYLHGRAGEILTWHSGDYSVIMLRSLPAHSGIALCLLKIKDGSRQTNKKVENATAVIWKMMMLAERRFRKLNAPDKLYQVFLGVSYHDGVEVKQEKELVTV